MNIHLYTKFNLIFALYMIDHVPVMLDEVLDSVPQNSKTIVDGTLGHGWHTREILQKFWHVQKLYWFDLDPNILSETKERLSDFSNKIHFVQSSYTNISNVLWAIKADFVLLDLWVNMEHFKDWSRGFSINYDSDLDMRFNDKQWMSAYDILNQYSIDDLVRVFVDYAEFTEKKSKEIAREIIKYRAASKIKTTFELKNVLWKAGLWQKASVVIFQAIRIETNKEIDNLKLVLEQIPDILSDWWRCGIISFHSIEDRVVKFFFKKLSKQKWFSLVSKKAIKPHYKEVQKNRASRSAKYRVIEKVIDNSEL